MKFTYNTIEKEEKSVAFLTSDGQLHIRDGFGGTVMLSNLGCIVNHEVTAETVGVKFYKGDSVTITF